ncbi:hypothetical protein ACFL7E_06190 [Thermodesulfobacteriota bacterium]
MDLRTDEAKNIFYIRLTESLNKEIILDAFDAAVSDESYKKGMGRLWDFRDADLSNLDSSTIAEMAKYSTKFPPGINDVKVAFVASGELEFGLSRMFGAFSMVAETTVSVFYTIEEAEAWLSL